MGTRVEKKTPLPIVLPLLLATAPVLLRIKENVA
jgi:hypothetical protein